jgi:TolB protein
MEADGSGLRRLTDHPAADKNPAWSPDGQWLVFSSERTGRGDIYLMDPDGGRLRRLTDHPAYEGVPRFDPDGRAIFFEGERDGRAEIYRVSLSDGAAGEVEPVTSSISRKLGPAPSPDGKKLAFMEKGLVRWQVSVLDIRSGESQQVTSGGGSCRPAWSPDGSLLAFVSTRESSKGDLWLREMQGARESKEWRVTTRADSHNYDPAFSPDGSAFAFASTRERGRGEQWDIFVSDLNGRNLVQLTSDNGSNRFPDWRP